jgi:glycosyltransferase involved in cell wall biosynthesis
MRRLVKHLQNNPPDVVHVQWSVVDRIDVPAWTRLRKRVPVVFTAHNSVGRTTDALGCEDLKVFDAVVAHTAFGEAGLRNECTLPNVWRVPMGADTSLRELVDSTPAPIDVGDGPLVVLPGLLRAYKGIDVLLQAWPEVHAQHPHATLLLAGRPVDADIPDELPAGVRLLPRYLSTGEFAWLLDRADVTCLPYTAIDLSGVLLSALALGSPLIVSDVGGLAEYAEYGAQVVPSGDIEALADCLSRVIGDETLRTSMSEAARTAADNVFSWRAIAERYTELYSQLASRDVASRVPSA